MLTKRRCDPNPFPDADRDGLDDAWERAYQLNPNDPADAQSDLDEDGLTVLEESLFGLHPRIADSAPRLLPSATSPEARVAFTPFPGARTSLNGLSTYLPGWPSAVPSGRAEKLSQACWTCPSLYPRAQIRPVYRMSSLRTGSDPPAVS